MLGTAASGAFVSRSRFHMGTRLNKMLLIAGTTLIVGSVAGLSPAMSPPTSHDDGHGSTTTSSTKSTTKTTEPAGKTSATKTPASKTTTKPPAKKDDHGDSHDDEHADEHDDAHGGDQGDSTGADKSISKDRKSTEARKSLFGDKEKTPSDKSTDDKKSDEKKDETVVNADSALSMLKEGNIRWVSGDVKNPSTDSSRRQLTSDKGQKPFATVLTCADSRIPLERVFDRGVGEVFAIRVAGNVAGDSETGTIEYGVGHLKTPLVVVMGHTKCGAVAAAASGAQLHGKVGTLVSHINPAVDRVKQASPNADQTELAALSVKENVWQSIFDLYKNSDEIREAARGGQVRVVGAVYDISTGKVEWLGEHPWQSQILDALEVKTASVGSDHE